MADAPIAQFKTCTKCGTSKPTDQFSKNKGRKDGLFSWCKPCKSVGAKAAYQANPEPKIRRAAEHRANKPEMMKRWRAENAERIHAYNLAYYRGNIDRERERNSRYLRENADKKRAYRLQNIERERARAALRRQRPKTKIDNAMSRAIHHALEGRKGGKRWETLVGYSVNDLMVHLESQFKPGMTWENHGQNGWHIDHIIPKSAFNYSSPDHIDFKRAWALSNLQPLWQPDNLRKSAKLSAPFQPSLQI